MVVSKLRACGRINHADQGSGRVTGLLLDASRTGGMTRSRKLERHRAGAHERVDIVQGRRCEAAVADGDARAQDRLRHAVDNQVVAVVRSELERCRADYRDPALTVTDLAKLSCMLGFGCWCNLYPAASAIDQDPRAGANGAVVLHPDITVRDDLSTLQRAVRTTYLKWRCLIPCFSSSSTSHATE